MSERPKLLWPAAAVLAVFCTALPAIQFSNPEFPPALWHLTPLFAAGILFGAGLSLWKAIGLMLAVRLTADLGIWAVTGESEYAFWGHAQWFNYLALAVIPLAGLLIGVKPKAAAILGAALSGPIAFFLISNFGVWAFQPSVEVRSLWHVYYDGLPFLRNSLLASPVWAALFFSPPVRDAIFEGDTSPNRVVA